MQEPVALGRQLRVVRLVEAPASISRIWKSSVSSALAPAAPGGLERSRASRSPRASAAAASATRVALLAGPGERVEELEGRARVHELLLGVLAEDRDQTLAHARQRPHRGGLVLDEGAALAVGRELAAQQRRLAARQARLREQLPDLGVAVELSRDDEPRSSLAHEVRRAAAARQQRERVDEDGLARARLAR